MVDRSHTKPKLNEAEKSRYFDSHFPHRLVLLRTFRIRTEDTGFKSLENGDVYRCAKDASLIAIRQWMDFFGMRATDSDAIEQGKRPNPKYEDSDLRFYHFTECVGAIDLEPDQEIKLIKAYQIADRELAHLTLRPVKRDLCEEETLIEASKIIEGIISEHLYQPLGRELPEHNECWRDKDDQSRI